MSKDDRTLPKLMAKFQGILTHHDVKNAKGMQYIQISNTYLKGLM